MPTSFGTERANPLPAGRYWVFRVGPKDVVAFDAWLTKWRQAKALRVLASELDPGPTTPEMSAFIVFEVLVPGVVVWDQPGLPDRAAPHVTSRQDVMESPRPKEPLDQFADSARAVARGAEQLPALLFIAGILYLYTQGSHRNAMHR